jgi:hypothetical protein
MQFSFLGGKRELSREKRKKIFGGKFKREDKRE